MRPCWYLRHEFSDLALSCTSCAISCSVFSFSGPDLLLCERGRRGKEFCSACVQSKVVLFSPGLQPGQVPQDPSQSLWAPALAAVGHAKWHPTRSSVRTGDVYPGEGLLKYRHSLIAEMGVTAYSWCPQPLRFSNLCSPNNFAIA